MYLNLVQLAESLGVEERTVEGWIRNDGLPCVPDRGRLLFDRSEVSAWAAARGLGAEAGFLAVESGAGGAGAPLSLGRLLGVGGIWRDVAAAEVLAVLEQVLAKLPGVAAAVRELLVRRIRAADGLTWAPVGKGVALPHMRSPAALGRDSGLVAVLLLRDSLRLREGVPDGEPIRWLVFFLAPSPRAHLEILARLSAGLSRGRLREVMVAGGTDEEILAAMEERERGSIGTGGA